MYIVILIIIVFLLVFLLYRTNKKYKKLEKELVDSACIKANEKVQEATRAYESLSKSVDELSSQYQKFSSITKEQIQKEIDVWKEEAITNTEREIDDCVTQIREQSFSSLLELLDIYQNKADTQQEEINELQVILDDYKQKQKTINEEIIRKRAVEEQTDFYRVVLEEESLDDITILQSIRKNLHHRENLDKLIYDNYISKPVNEMVKRVLNGKAPSGIYKITRLNTGEIYIGKSTNIKERWQQHAKTAFNCGTIAHSILHTTMAKDGLENFTFELLEEVPKDKLSEKEKYYIDFYGSKEYGLNEKAGG